MKEYAFPAKFYKSILQNCFALRNSHLFSSVIAEDIISEVAVYSFFDIAAELQETVQLMPIDNPPPSSLADRLRALKEKQTRTLQIATNTNNNNNNVQSAENFRN
jgi:hypothetical protein